MACESAETTCHATTYVPSRSDVTSTAAVSSPPSRRTGPTSIGAPEASRTADRIVDEVDGFAEAQDDDVGRAIEDGVGRRCRSEQRGVGSGGAGDECRRSDGDEHADEQSAQGDQGRRLLICHVARPPRAMPPAAVPAMTTGSTLLPPPSRRRTPRSSWSSRRSWWERRSWSSTVSSSWTARRSSSSGGGRGRNGRGDGGCGGGGRRLGRRRGRRRQRAPAASWPGPAPRPSIRRRARRSSGSHRHRSAARTGSRSSRRASTARSCARGTCPRHRRGGGLP